jgi:hypothetical protein
MTLLFALLVLGSQAVFAADPPARPTAPPNEPKKSGTATPKPGLRFEGGDGSSQEKAVIIKGARNSEAGVHSEYDWLRKKYPGYKMKQQSLQSSGGKSYDVLAIRTKDGKDLDVWFDITEFFGKF